MSKQELINKLIEISNEISANSGLLLAIADVETGGKFNIDAGKGGNYVGLFQLSNGYGGCNGDDRLDLRKSAICTWKQIERNKQNFVKNMGYWEDWFAYGIHQQGLSGFEYLLKNKDKKVSEIDAKRQRNIRTNIPKTLTVTYVCDFLDYWRNRINNLIKVYNGNNYSDGNLTVTQKLITETFEAKNLLFSGIAGLLLSGAIYIIIDKKIFNK